jgi:hypothetical protein
MARDPARIATFALMTVAYAACEVASYLDGRPRPFGVAFGVGLVAVAIAIARLVPSSGTVLSRRWQLAMAAFLVAPLALEPLLRAATGNGFPPEMQLVNGLRIAGVLLAGLSAIPRVRRLCGIIALFLALFASAMGDQPAIPFLLALFSLAGGVWLILNHRAASKTAAIGRDSVAVTRLAMRWPMRETAVFSLLVVSAAALAIAGPKRVVLRLGELMPTSGGTGATDLFARFGLGDGPEETAGDNARTAGMVETDKMIEDNKNSLIDAINDMYGPPHKPPKDRERMVAAGKADVIENHGRLPENKRPSRDFDTSRSGPKSRPKPDGGHAARGLFEIRGRTPLHLRFVAYADYDLAERRWIESPKPNGLLIEADEAGRDWMGKTNINRNADWYAADDEHEIKIANLKDNVVPTPGLTKRFRINKVDRPDYYEWDYDGVLAFVGRKTMPAGTIVHAESRTLDIAELTERAFANHPHVGPPSLLNIPEPLRDELKQLARSWAGDLPRGGGQIAAILDRMKSAYVLDPTAVPPVDHPNPIRWFLVESRRGPDYLFASATVLLLRSLDYPSRMSLGYYASPEAFDADSGHTPVRKTDLHLWPEVLMKDNHWLIVEPTPGYATLPSIRPWPERIAAWGKRNAIAIAIVFLVAVAVRRWWRRVVDAALTLAWRLRPLADPRSAAANTIRLLEARSRLAHAPRRPSETLAGWLARLPAANETDRTSFRTIADWAVYAPNQPPPLPPTEIVPVCRRIEAAVPFSRWATKTATR